VYIFINVHSPPLNTADITKQIVVIINASKINILNTSFFLAPTARKIPISLFLEEIETAIKLNNISAANKPVLLDSES
jgi:hypothetical protein